LVFLAAVLVLSRLPAAAIQLDLNANGMSDVWEQMYGASALSSNADTDGDGAPNWLESIAGTDPKNAASKPVIPSITRTNASVTVTIPCALGKQYQLQSILPVSGSPWTNWVVEYTTVPRSGTNVILTATAGSSAKFYRIGIADVDTDGDGLSDWEEYQLGLDPFKASSNNQLDNSGQPMADYNYASSRMASQNVVTITAPDAFAIEPDAGQTAQDFGQFTVTRGGFPLNSITVNLGLGGPGASYATNNVDHLSLPPTVTLLPGSAFANITLRPLANTNLLKPVVAMLKVLPGTGYTIGSASNASVTISPSQTPKGTGLTGQYYTNSSATYSSSVNFNAANLKLTRVDTNIDFTWGTASIPIANSSGFYCVRWTGQIQPQYSESYWFVANTDDGLKLWVNGQLVIDAWTNKSAGDVTSTPISLQAGVRYDIKMEYYQNNGSAVAHLSWYSFSQPKQVVPMARLYPASVAQAPTSIVSAGEAFGFVGQPFSFTVSGANSATTYSATGLPPGLTLTNTTGVIGGIPTLAGTYQVMLTASNSVGVSGSAVSITIYNTGSSLVREVWTNAPGSTIDSIPLDSPPSSTASLGSLQGVTDFGDNYGERVRGYITIPTTGNYYFWIAGSDAAELYISNDSEPVNKIRRAYVLPTPNPGAPPALGTGSSNWNVQASQKSGWLTMNAGQKYYIEILHKAGVGAGDNWAVGWLLDSTGTNNAPSGVPPSYLLSPYYTPPSSVAPGALYVATMLPGSGVTNMPIGSATLRMSADNSHATLSYSDNGLSSTVIGEHINNDPYGANPSQIMFDISAATPQPDGTYTWPIRATGTLSAADIMTVLNEGKGYIIVLTAGFPDGELIGHFEKVEGSTTFTNPPAPPTWADDHSSTNAAVRFLTQATFGPSPADIDDVRSNGYTNWLTTQFSLPTTRHLSMILTNTNPDPTSLYDGNHVFNNWWNISINAPDQLRQRVAFALSELLVVSDQGVLQDRGTALTSYYDMLADNAFGNFRQLLEAATLHPAMGLYLNMQGNDKGSIISGTHANENYAREIMQLFSIGLYRLWPDGSLIMTSTGDLVPTYDQNVIMGFAAAFTGWNYYQPNQGNGRLPSGFTPGANYTNSMVLVPTHHDLNTKLLLDNTMLPAALGAAANSSNTNYDIYCSNDLELALDNIANDPNVGPFVCRQLIQRLVTSHPTPAYVYRVTKVFNDNGAGVRGDMQAVISAILLDYEARSPAMLSSPTFGKQREPLLRITAAARAFPAPAPLDGTYTQPTNQSIYCVTPTPHRLTNNETLYLSFTDSSGQPAPSSQPYSVTTTSPTAFTVNAGGMTGGTYTQQVNVVVSNVLTASMVTTNVIVVTNNSHGLSAGFSIYLNFVTGGAISAAYQVINVIDVNRFIVIASDAVARSGSLIFPKIGNGGFVVSSKTNTLYATSSGNNTPLAHGLSPGDSVFINFIAAGSPADGIYQVLTVPDESHFTFLVPASVGNQTQNGATVFPLVAPKLGRAGSVTIRWGTYLLNATDTGGTFSLAQTPLNSPTVFNFFFPDYKFPGPLSTAGLTTPEFQLTSDTSAMFQMNFTQAGLLANGSTNGLSSFSTAGNGNGMIVIDINPWMTSAYTANAGIPSLISALNTRLCGGVLSGSVSNVIYGYVANTSNFPYTTPTPAQMRDRVRAVAHLILCSPDYVIQR